MEQGFFADKRKRLMEAMEDGTAMVLFSGMPPVKTADEEYYFAPNRNFYYLSGIDRENCALLLTKQGGVHEQLFIPDNASGLGGAGDHPLTQDEACSLSGIKNVHGTEAFEGVWERLMSRQPIETLYLDLERRSLRQQTTEAQAFAHRMGQCYPFLQIKNAYFKIANMRRFKEAWEVDQIRKAIDITREGIEAMMRTCRPGIHEYELEAEFMYRLMRHGHREAAFKSIIAAGKNALIGHYSANRSKIGEDELVLADVGAPYGLYASDISRAFPASGSFGARRRLYDVLLDANKALILSLKPGVTMRDANKENADALADALASIGLTPETSAGLSVYCGPNHYLGLDVHDVGLYDIPFAPGMVFAVESSVTIPAEGLSFRIEDDVLITEGGRENLSEAILKEADAIEDMMRQGRKAEK